MDMSKILEDKKNTRFIVLKGSAGTSFARYKNQAGITDKKITVYKLIYIDKKRNEFIEADNTSGEIFSIVLNISSKVRFAVNLSDKVVVNNKKDVDDTSEYMLGQFLLIWKEEDFEESIHFIYSDNIENTSEYKNIMFSTNGFSEQEQMELSKIFIAGVIKTVNPAISDKLNMLDVNIEDTDNDKKSA